MKNDQLLNQILPILHSVKDDEGKLQQILDFLLEEIYEEPDEELIIPERYRELVRKTAESIDCGMIWYINPETLEMEDVPKSLLEGYYDLEEEDDDDDNEMLNQAHRKWEKCIEVEPRESSESFRIMEQFIGQVGDKKLSGKLVNALRNRHPFSNFKNLIDNSEFRENWFAFKRQKLEELVWGELSWQLESNEDIQGN